MLSQYHRLYNSVSESLLRKSLLKPLQQINNSMPDTNWSKDKNCKRTNQEQHLPNWLQEALLEKMGISSLNTAQIKLHRYITAPSAVGDKRKHQRHHHIHQQPPPPLLLVKGSTGQGKSIGYLMSTLSTLFNPAATPLTSPTISSNRSNRKAIKTTTATTTTTTTKTQIPVAPRILILTPTAILQQQLLNWTSTIISSNQFLDSKHDSIVQVTSSRSGGGDDDDDDAMLGGTPHLLIATPKEALEMYSNALLVSDNLELLIMDEVDSLLGLTRTAKAKNNKKSLHHHVKPALSLYRQICHGNSALKYNPPLKTIVCSATLPSSEVLSLLDASNHTEIDFTPASAGGSIRSSGDVSASNTNDKVKHYYRSVSNEEEIVRFVKALIGERLGKTGLIVLPKEYSKLCFIESLALQDSCDVSLMSMAPSNADGLAFSYSFTKMAMKTKPKILIGSESDCRGLDLPALQYIIVLDVPSKPSEWLHIIGRLGRLGQQVGDSASGGASEIITIVNGSSMLQRLMDVYDRYDGLPRPLLYR